VADIVSLAETIAEAVHDGDTMAMEGFTHLIPHAAGREVIRRGGASSPDLQVPVELREIPPPSAAELTTLRGLLATMPAS
jgi:hypothetical protein